MAKTAAKKSNVPVPKDDGTRWTVARDGRPVYISHGGVPQAAAEKLAEGLLEPAEIIQVEVPVAPPEETDEEA